MDGFASMVSSSLGLGGEFMTPIGKGVENATSESLVNPDWTLNMQICDEVGTVAERRMTHGVVLRFILTSYHLTHISGPK